MEKITLELFTSANEDVEKRQYLILAYLQKCLLRFKRNKLYPALGDLSNLYQQLTALKKSIEDMNSEFPKRLKGINTEKSELEYEIVAPGIQNMDSLQALIDWALPRMKEVIEEGAAMFEFITEHMELEKVGIMPSYQNEGYFIIPDNLRKNLRLYLFEISLYSAADEQYRTLKTHFIKTLAHNYIDKPPSSIKLELIEKHKELPNPATFACQTDLDFPFRESIYPVARRKFMQQFYA